MDYFDEWEAADENSENTPFDGQDAMKDAPFYSNNYVPSHLKRERGSIFCSPRSIYQYLDEHVYGHEDYKRAISTFAWKIVNGHHPEGALLIAGESGTGKTELFRVLKKAYGNITIADGASVVPQGYKGSNTLFGAFLRLDFNTEDTPPILVIDEFDKLVDKSSTTWGNQELIGELLKCLEGEAINISGDEKNPKIVDTARCSFVLLGSFSGITDKKTAHPIGFGEKSERGGMRPQLTEEQIRALLSPELNGRIEGAVILKNFEKADYLRILRDERYSPVSRIAREYGVDFRLSYRKYLEISTTAYENRTGVRSMNNEISRILNEKLFDDPQIKEIMVE